jgi:hypothetical protein
MRRFDQLEPGRWELGLELHRVRQVERREGELRRLEHGREQRLPGSDDREQPFVLPSLVVAGAFFLAGAFLAGLLVAGVVFFTGVVVAGVVFFTSLVVAGAVFLTGFVLRLIVDVLPLDRPV